MHFETPLTEGEKEMLSRGNYIQTRHRDAFFFQNPKPQDFLIEDIAHALSNICRYGGHAPYHYSVSQHSVLCATVAPPGFEYEALMHDRAEAYIIDMPSPIKAVLPDYRALERCIEEVSARAFGLPLKMSPEVKSVDLSMMVTEAQQFFADHENKWWLGHPALPYPIHIERWTPEQAKASFLSMFHQLVPRDVYQVAA